MPFTKTGKDTYTSPSGRHFNGAQVRLYYAHGGHFPGEKEKKMSYAKGSAPKEAHYAKGGEVLQTSNSIFLKTPDEFRDDCELPDGKDQNFAKKGAASGKGQVPAPAVKNK